LAGPRPRQFISSQARGNEGFRKNRRYKFFDRQPKPTVVRFAAGRSGWFVGPREHEIIETTVVGEDEGKLRSGLPSRCGAPFEKSCNSQPLAPGNVPIPREDDESGTARGQSWPFVPIISHAGPRCNASWKIPRPVFARAAQCNPAALATILPLPLFTVAGAP